jgi:hypothetical protein
MKYMDIIPNQIARKNYNKRKVLIVESFQV